MEEAWGAVPAALAAPEDTVDKVWLLNDPSPCLSARATPTLPEEPRMHKPAMARQRRPLAIAPCLLALCVLAVAARADETEETPRLEDFLEAPPPPEVVRSGEPLEPEVTIIQRGEQTIQEYRLGGRMYMVKVTPTKGPAYYFIDQDGDGKLETRSDTLDDPLVPHWVIFSW